ncbi:MAG TPA: D-isomer specific 2-hydroxyacid dehydrogenase family protein [Egibacteraceae bacterium]|nr:D-isomer specific 2-hydroxyacid dehydrogenase family protein [Egibacteraceae bacterium]
MPPPRVAIGPADTRDWVRAAVLAGGGQVVAPAEADALIWLGTGYGPDPARGPEGLRALLHGHPGIRWIQLPFAGVEPFAQAGVLTADRVWTAGQGVYARPVAEHALTLALAGLRELPRRVLAREWEAQSGMSLIGGRVTIFGGGGIARELIGLLAPFDCDITVVRRRPEPVPGAARTLGFGERYEALKGADVVVLALALTAETDGLVGAVELELMEPHAWLVNVARGRHVVTEDLVDALREGAIGGAGLDVVEPEPLPPGHPLWSLPNCILTPHTANTEAMGQPLLAMRIRENVQRFGSGQPLLGLVDPELGY